MFHCLLALFPSTKKKKKFGKISREYHTTYPRKSFDYMSVYIAQGITILKASVQIKCVNKFCKEKAFMMRFFKIFFNFFCISLLLLYATCFVTCIRTAYECVNDRRCAEANCKLTSCISRSSRGMRMMHGGKSFTGVKECKRILPSQTKYEQKKKKARTTITTTSRREATDATRGRG